MRTIALFFRLSILLPLAVLSGASCSSPRSRTDDTIVAARDYTILVFSDIHLGAEDPKAEPPVTPADTLARVTSRLEAMRSCVGRAYPSHSRLAGSNLGTVDSPRGLFILGDLTDGHKEETRQREQWDSFEQLFPVEGVLFGDHRVPVFACSGNHDGDPSGPVRQGLVKRNREFARAGRLGGISTNGVHFAVNWDGVHFVCLNLCPAESTDTGTPFKYGKPGPGSWNDPEGALSFLEGYLAREVRDSGEPVVLMHHYGFDGFSMNDWYWWTPSQRRELHELLQGYHIAAIFHGHNHHAEHYRWPDPKLHAAEIEYSFDGKAPPGYRQYDILSCGAACWVIRIRGNQLIAAHFRGPGWTTDPGGFFVKSLEP